MRKTHNSLWSTPHFFIAFNPNNWKVVGHGDNERQAKSAALQAGTPCPSIIPRRDLLRPTIDLNDIKHQTLVLMVGKGNNWEKGKLFWIKSTKKEANHFKKEQIDKVLIKGLYLTDLLDMPWFMLTDANLFSKQFKRFGSDEGYSIYEPVISEVKRHMPLIRKYMHEGVISSSVCDYEQKNKEINALFTLLEGQIRETNEEDE